MIFLLRLLFLIVFFKLSLFANIDFTKKEKTYIKNNIVKVAMLPDFPPFSVYKDGKLRGFSFDILELISKKSSLEFRYEIDKWPINLKKFKEKKVDIIDSISFKENRLQFTNYTKSYYDIPLMIFSRKELTQYKDLSSLKGKKLGITKNIFYKKQVEDLDIFKLVEYDSFEDKLNALAFGEVDVIFGHLLSTQIAIKQKQFTNMKVLDELNLPNLNKTDLRFGITKENEVLHSIIEKTFNSISKIELNELRNKWIDTYTSEKKKNNILEDLTKKERYFLVRNKIKCIGANIPPFIFTGNKPSGISIDFWNLIKEKALINSFCETVDNMEEVLKKIQKKEADVAIVSTITEDKLSFARFSNPYVHFPLVIATTLDKRYIVDTSVLNNRKVGLIKNSSITDILKVKYPQVKFVFYENDFEVLKALSNNEIFATVDILPKLSNAIKEYGFSNIKISGTTNYNFDIRIMVRDDFKTLIPILNKAISSIPKAKSQEIKNKWTSVKYEEIIDYSKFWKVGIVISIILVVIIYRQIVLNTHNKKLREANNDIESKSKELEEKTLELNSQKMLFEKLFEESSDGIFLGTLGKDKKIVKVNNRACEILGYDNKQEFLSNSKTYFLPPLQPDGNDSIRMIEYYFEHVIKHGNCTFEMVHKKKDGSLIWLEVVLTLIRFENQNLIHNVWRDIQKRKDIEDELNQLTTNLEFKVQEEISKNEEKTKQLIQQSRLAQMGEMLSMIAHQWRQPLTAISATTNNLLIRLMIDEKIEKKELEKELSLVSDYSVHLSTTIDDFRNFFRMDKEKVPSTLEEIINNSISIVKNSLESNNIKLIIQFGANESLMLHKTEINQVILNILKNAEDALVDNLVLNSEIKIKTFIKDSKAYIEISDNAKGIDEKIIDKIFDPYFSTKSEKEGTGLGLYMSKTIINDHCGGSLSVRNSQKGAIFSIELPKE